MIKLTHLLFYYCFVHHWLNNLPQINNIISLPKTSSSMGEQNVQLLMTSDSITVNTSMFEGVVTSKTFEGPDCYLKLVDFLKQYYFADQVIHAVIVVR